MKNPFGNSHFNSSRLNLIIALIVALGVLIVGYTLLVTMAASVEQIPTRGVPTDSYKDLVQ